MVFVEYTMNCDAMKDCLLSKPDAERASLISQTNSNSAAGELFGLNQAHSSAQPQDVIFENAVVQGGAISTDVSATVLFSEHTDEPAVNSVRLDVLRYVNLSPLLDFGEEGYCCLIIRALRRVRWAAFGCILKNSVHEAQKNPQFEVELLTPSPDKKGDRTVSRIVLVININAVDVPFTSLRKTAIGDSKEILPLVVRGKVLELLYCSTK